MILNDSVQSKGCGTVFIYLKIGSKVALDNMRKGNWWFRHPAYFQYEETCNHDKERGDATDSQFAEKMHFTYDLQQHIQTNVGCIPPQTISQDIFIDRPESEIDCDRILCFYRLEVDDAGKCAVVSHKMKQFGDYFSIVDIDRLIDCLSNTDSVFTKDDANYYATDYSDLIGPFGKPTDYRHQNEFRLRLTNKRYGKQIQDDKHIQELRQLHKKAISIMLDSHKKRDERLKSYDFAAAFEKEICKQKAQYYEEIKTVPGLLTEARPIEQLFQNDILVL